MHGTVLGRDDVLDRARAALHDPGRLLIEGPAGIGKTALLHAVVEAAEEQGRRVLSCAPAETEAALPLAALTDLLGPLVADLDGLPGPQQHAARSALLLVDDPGPVDERALAAATVGLLDAAAERHPGGLVVAVDDAPWLDPPSERALRFALRRVSPRVRVVVARRSGARPDPRVPLDLDAHTPVERLSLSPLGVGPLHHLVAQRFGVSLSRPLITRVTRDSGGNPLLAIELARAVLRLPRLPGPGDDLPVPASMQDLVDASLATLSPDQVRAVRAAALLSAPHLTDLRATGGSPDDLDAAEEAGLVVVDGTRVRFAHPSYASAVRAGIPGGVRHRLHGLLAETASDPDERARHLAQFATDPDDVVATSLGEAAGRARARGAPELGAALYERAAALSERDATATRFRLRALYCLFDNGNYSLVAEQVDALTPRLHGDPLAEALLLSAAIAFFTDDLPRATSTARRAFAAAAPGSRLAGQILAHLASFTDAAVDAHRHAAAALAILDGRSDATVDEERDAGGNVLGRTDRDMIASVLMLAFVNEVRTGLPPRLELLERALDLEAGNPTRLAGTVPAIWWKGIDEQELARDRLESMLDTAAAHGDEPLQHELLEHLADADILAGRYGRASAWVDGARELAGQLGAGIASDRWLGGMIDAFRGDLAAARTAGEAGLAEAAASDDLWLRRISLQLLAFTALADGRMDDAAATYTELGEAMDAGGLVEPLGTRFEADWLEACVGVGDLATAGIALARLIRRHERLPRPWTTLGLARSRVLLAGATGEDTAGLVEELLAAREAVPPDVVPFDRARCLLVAGLALRRARRRGAARDVLLAAATEFDAIGARAFAARARGEADRIGGRVAAPDDLTSSELRVAELAASGATNREIADALFIAHKTVEANLARIYRKLAIGRRVELAGALQTLNGRQTQGFD